MKKLVAIICLLGTSFFSNALEEEIVKSTISNVTVYSQGAQIFRKASFNVKTGVSQIILENVSSYLDAKSIQVKATGGIIILDTKFSMYYPKPEEISLEGLPLKVRQDIQRLEDSLEWINFDLQTLQNEIDVLNATKSILANNGAVRGQGKVNDSIALLKETIDYYTIKMNELNVKLGNLNRKKATKTKERDAMSGRLTKLRNYQSSNNLTPANAGPIPRIIITVQATTPVSGKLDVSYLVSQAGWIPLYDLRSEIATGQVNLNYKAQVFQSTGEKWDNVRLTISTNNPYQNKTKPTLHPWYVNYASYQQGYAAPSTTNNMSTGIMYKEKAASEDRKKTEAYSTADYESSATTADQFVTMVNQTISAEFIIDLPYTIESNNEQHMVLISNKDLKANYKYFTVPKADKSAYLVAQISKLEELQLVPAKASIFFDGSYIGETYLDPTSLDDTLNLSLGKDPNIIVKRTYLKNDTKEKIVGNYIEKTYTYLIEVKNQKATNIDIIIQDQIPVAYDGDIEITLLESAKAKYNSVTGLLEWDSKLKPKQSELIQFSYKVKYNKDKQLNL
ncbi:DUF4139 domain-containing protein [Crocinitomicaceae bacterium CZZ-1]|uniref:DUF4139 domain-containing protein n=1 Tax=Taishania pollutisoli TaxID=2766479 RepID=A0A8J6U2U8_9FLAO|nr:DUF4139 domain-containing protein [Taishania pollutisoli]MBC9813765.1 DUF4139 domain-containing protein [Taishania pollutisoli]